MGMPVYIAHWAHNGQAHNGPIWVTYGHAHKDTPIGTHVVPRLQAHIGPVCDVYRLAHMDKPIHDSRQVEE